MLESVDLSRSLANGEYKRRRTVLRRRLLDLQRACWNADVGSLLLFEGWAFSGRGGVVRKLTQRLEPRGFVLHHVRAPRTWEDGLPWMWRFWHSLPRFGQMGIYYGSWYRRLLVGRSSGVVSEDAARRSVRDIESFERMLTLDRYVIAKFFFHIDLHEQSDRISEAEADPLEEWKLETDEWDKRVLDPHNLKRAEEMLAQTSFESTPWSVVAANDTNWATVDVFERVARALEEGLVRHGAEIPEDRE